MTIDLNEVSEVTLLLLSLKARLRKQIADCQQQIDRTTGRPNPGITDGEPGSQPDREHGGTVHELDTLDHAF